MSETTDNENTNLIDLISIALRANNIDASQTIIKKIVKIYRLIESKGKDNITLKDIINI